MTYKIGDLLTPNESFKNSNEYNNLFILVDEPYEDKSRNGLYVDN